MYCIDPAGSITTAGSDLADDSHHTRILVAVGYRHNTNKGNTDTGIHTGACVLRVNGV